MTSYTIEYVDGSLTDIAASSDQAAVVSACYRAADPDGPDVYAQGPVTQPDGGDRWSLVLEGSCEVIGYLHARRG